MSAVERRSRPYSGGPGAAPDGGFVTSRVPRRHARSVVLAVIDCNHGWRAFVLDANTCRPGQCVRLTIRDGVEPPPLGSELLRADLDVQVEADDRTLCDRWADFIDGFDVYGVLS